MTQTKHDHGHHHGQRPHAGVATPRAPQSAMPETIDPVCGMSVDPTSALSHRHGEQTYYFCSARCRDRLAAEPAK
jgi:Cu+-exporting ATPase